MNGKTLRNSRFHRETFSPLFSNFAQLYLRLFLNNEAPKPSNKIILGSGTVYVRKPKASPLSYILPQTICRPGRPILSLSSQPFQDQYADPIGILRSIMYLFSGMTGIASLKSKYRHSSEGFESVSNRLSNVMVHEATTAPVIVLLRILAVKEVFPHGLESK